MISKKDLQLTGTYQNIEMAIVEAIHLLAPFSDFQDESCRCKDIYGLVKGASIQIEGHIQQGNHRFTLFSSALCGRRSSLFLFQKITDKDRRGSWWKLKIPYEEAIGYAASIHSKHPSKFNDISDSHVSLGVAASRQEIVRGMFMSFVPVSLMVNELSAENNQLKNKQNELQQKIQQLKSESSPETLRSFERLTSLQFQLNELYQNKTPQQDMQGNSHQMPFFQ